MSNKIMSWSRCTIKIAKTEYEESGAEKMPDTLKEMGIIKYQSTNIEVEDGDELIARETGGKTIAREVSDGDTVLTTRIIEPDDALFNELFGTVEQDGVLKVTTHIVPDYFAVEVSPKNVGATGIKAKKCNVTFKPGWSDEEGQYADVTFTFLACSDGELYSRFKKS